MTGRAGFESNRDAAFSTRRRRMKALSVSPTMALKMRWKWNGEKGGHAGEGLEREVAREIGLDVVDHPVDAAGILGPQGASSGVVEIVYDGHGPPLRVRPQA